MVLTINNPVGGAGTATPTAPLPNSKRYTTHHSILRQFPSYLSLSLSLSSSRTTFIVAATGKFTSRNGKFDSKNRRSSTTTTENDDEAAAAVEERNDKDVIDDGYVLPPLPGDKPDFWEGPQWDALGFFVQYMWAFGIVFALIACGIAVATYNEGATDFRETPAYKESIQSQDLLEGPEASDTDVFESNPTEEAPALE